MPDQETIESWYVDQCGSGINVPGFQCNSFYTPDGIKKIDSRFCHRIWAFKEGKSYTEYSYSYKDCARLQKPPTREVEMVWTDTLASLSKDILENPHLHPRIKENLLYNLDRNLFGKLKLKG